MSDEQTRTQGANAMKGLAEEAQYQLHNYQKNKQESQMQKNAFDYQTKLNEQMRQQRILSKVDEVSAMRLAGLTPSLATGNGGFAAAGSGGSVPAPTSPMQHVSGVNPVEAMQVGSNIKLQNAQANLLEQQAKVEAEKARSMGDKNDTANALIIDWATRVSGNKNASADDKATAEFILGSNEAYSSGTIEAIEQFRDLALHDSQRAKEITSNAFEKSVLDLKGKNGAASYLASMDRKEFEKICKQVGDLQESLLLKRAQRALTLVDIEKAGYEMKNIMQNMLKTYHSDPAAMLDNGDWKALGVYTFQSILNASESAIAGRFAAGGIPHSEPPKQSVGKEDRRSETRTRYNKKGEVIGSETISRMGQLYDIFDAGGE